MTPLAVLLICGLGTITSVIGILDEKRPMAVPFFVIFLIFNVMGVTVALLQLRGLA